MVTQAQKRPSVLLSVIPIVVLVALLSVTISVFGSDALNGGSQVVLLATTAVATSLAMFFCGTSWKEIETAI